ncbi:MAG TPA: alpha/beta hydrolase domain-containing protein [Stellaceae bacterium]|nr:alpha/beta hydrolase domain-containing protein [Stellaceae bacterium]
MGVLALAPGDAAARVAKFEILNVESPTFDGRTFGAVGAYEKITARATVALDATDRHNSGIVDLDLAPKNATQEVSAVADVVILRPLDPAKGSGRILYDVVNRGHLLGLALMNDAPPTDQPSKAADMGNGFLMRAGYTIVWSGWQGDLAPGGGTLTLRVPTAPQYTGPSREEWVFDDERNPVAVRLTYPTADMNPAGATLTVRERERDPRQSPPDLSFRYLSASEIEIWRPEGFDAGAIYELIYTAKNSKVTGFGFAAARDLVSFLRYGDGDQTTGANPLRRPGAPPIRHAYALGISQGGRFLRDFLYQGFNEDEAGRPVFDGLMPYAAGAAKTYVNFRFAQPGRVAHQHESHLYQGDQFPFTYEVLDDPLTRLRDGILARCLAARNCPKIIQTDTGTEMMQGRGFLITTDPSGRAAPLPENVRAYLLAGLPHFNPAGAESRSVDACQAPSNPLSAGPAMRALLAALDRWVSEAAAPPESRYPSLGDGTLVAADPAEAAYPHLPHLAYAGVVNTVAVKTYGEGLPVEDSAYPMLIPKVDADGTGVAGIRLPPVAAPLGTYLGWNLRKPGYAEGELCGVTGSFIPFAATRAARLKSGDARRSLAERYPTHAAYVAAVRKASQALVAEGLLLGEDADRYAAAAERSRVRR